MTILADHEIRQLCIAADDWPMIEPFVESQQRYKTIGSRVYPIGSREHPEGRIEPLAEPVISYGLSSYGYDIRVDDRFQIFTHRTDRETIVDPKHFDTGILREESGKGYCILPPNSFTLARSVEYFRIPRDILALCLCKSSYARIGLVVNFTPFEPGFEGTITIELSNTTSLPIKVYGNEGIAQVIFMRGNPCETSYADRAGKYQGQVDITPAKV